MGITGRDRNRDEKILAMYNEGYSCAVVGKSFGVTRDRIRQILLRCKAEGYKVRTSDAPRIRAEYVSPVADDPKIIKKVLKLYKPGCYISHIAKKVGISCTTIEHILRKQNIERSPKNNYQQKIAPDDYKKIYELYTGGLPVAKLAKRYKVSECLIYKVIVLYQKMNGVPVIDKRRK
jgi:transposase